LWAPAMINENLCVFHFSSYLIRNHLRILFLTRSQWLRPDPQFVQVEGGFSC